MSPIRKARNLATLTQAELAAAAGISQGHYSDIEAGKEQASPLVASRIAEKIGRDLINELVILYPDRYPHGMETEGQGTAMVVAG